MISMRIRNFDRVRNMLRHLAATQPDLTDEIVGDWAKDMRGTLKGTPYPQRRPNQTYVRTGQVANRWAALQVRSGIWEITNSAKNPKTGEPYAYRVVGDDKGEDQAWMHLHRWYLFREVIDGFAGDLTRRMTRSLENYWRDNG